MNCKIHNIPLIKDTENRTRCIKCRSQAVQKRREKLKAMSIEYKGGCCFRCGYNKCSNALEFHHLDPSQKEFSLSHRGLTRSWEKIQIELDKCVLVCANCHREIHSEETNGQRKNP